MQTFIHNKIYYNTKKLYPDLATFYDLSLEMERAYYQTGGQVRK